MVNVDWLKEIHFPIAKSFQQVAAMHLECTVTPLFLMRRYFFYLSRFFWTFCVQKYWSKLVEKATRCEMF